ncbi:transmembrane protein, putative, partial [Rhizoctonia solani AG-3 Rhs1AP]
MVVFWGLVILDDIFVLTIDLKRTYTYLGCIAAQAGINFFFSVFITLYATPQEMGGYFYFQTPTILGVSSQERLIDDSNGVDPSQGGADITVSASWSDEVGRNYETYGEANCTVQWSKNLTTYTTVSEYHNRTLELYSCNHTWTDKFGNYDRFNKGGWLNALWRQMFVYHITVQPKSSTSNRRTLNSQMPYIWLLNSYELASNLSLAQVDEVRSYLPPWELLRGSHVEAEAKLITRRFIKSSIMRDIFCMLSQ